MVSKRQKKMHHHRSDEHESAQEKDERHDGDNHKGNDNGENDSGSYIAEANPEGLKEKEDLSLFGRVSRVISGDAPDSTYKSLDKAFSIASKIVPVLIVLFVLFLGGFIRATPAWVPMADEWAADSINNQLRMQIAQQVQQQFPNLPPENMEDMIDDQLDQFIEENREMYQLQLEQASDFFRSQLQDDDGTTYLTGIDPYHWYRLARNVVRRGAPGDDYIEGRGEVDRLMFYPRGLGDTARRVDTETNIYIGAYSYMFLSNFFPDLSLMRTVFYFTVVLAPLTAIPAFFIAKKFGGIVAGSIAAFIVAIHPSFVSRTMGGFFDTDLYNLGFPLFIVWFMIEALYAKTWKKTAMFSALALLSTVLFAFSWQGWWYIFLVVFLAMAGYAVWLLALAMKKDKSFLSIFTSKESRRKLGAMGGFALGSMLIAGITAGFDTVIRIFYEYPMSVIRIRDVARYDIWPNVMTTVAELNPSAHSDIVSAFNGPLMFSMAFIGCIVTLAVWKKEHMWREIAYVGGSLIYYMVVLANPDAWNYFVFAVVLSLPVIGKAIFNLYFYPYKDIKDIRVPYAALITVWLVSMVFASTRGVRFNMLIVPPFALGFGILMGVLSTKVSEMASKNTGFNLRAVSVLVGALFIGLFMMHSADGGFLDSSVNTARNYLPHMNDAWYHGLQGINETGSNDAVIGSWWDYGHWFKAIAERAVFFDGGSQNTNTAHWMGRSLLSEDEVLTAGLLRKMSCGRNEAYNLLSEDSPLSGPDSVNILYDVVRTNSTGAKEIMLDAGVSESIAEEVLEYTHCEPPEVYYITSEDMVGKGGVWGHFGAWDFHRAEQYINVRQADRGEGIEMLIENYSYDEARASEIYNEIQTQDPEQWIAPWPGYLGAPQGCSRQEEDLHLCRLNIQGQQLNLLFNESSGDTGIVAPGQDMPDATPSAVSYVENGGFRKNEFDDAMVPYGMTFISSGDSYRVALMDPKQTASMFTRLFFHDGAGTNFFDKVYDEHGIPGGRVIIWRVNWERFFEHIGSDTEDLDFDEAEEFESRIEVPEAEAPAQQQPAQPIEQDTEVQIMG